MIEYLMLNMKLKEEKEDIVIYYYECDILIKDYNTAGIIEINKSIFADLNLDGDKLMYASDHYLNDNARVLRNATNIVFDNEGKDWVALFAIEKILTEAKEKGYYVEDLLVVSDEIKEMIMQDEVFLENLKYQFK